MRFEAGFLHVILSASTVLVSTSKRKSIRHLLAINTSNQLRYHSLTIVNVVILPNDIDRQAFTLRNDLLFMVYFMNVRKLNLVMSIHAAVLNSEAVLFRIHIYF